MQNACSTSVCAIRRNLSANSCFFADQSFQHAGELEDLNERRRFRRHQILRFIWCHKSFEHLESAKLPAHHHFRFLTRGWIFLSISHIVVVCTFDGCFTLPSIHCQYFTKNSHSTALNRQWKQTQNNNKSKFTEIAEVYCELHRYQLSLTIV